eukprot:CAMPEP_0170198792 /NCGR_PEP_ID=MMETSP0040_2-20121228/68979_1 /TAXON_ID=641309 /ORGANISM="Lotharella oceanica, Strain CCMP622" /LENGTH=197 /DNA_ID=CAMNT_0010448841 /DNA_START=434 /DNA_END=1027 /DNA_ORIENTATION=+
MSGVLFSVGRAALTRTFGKNHRGTTLAAYGSMEVLAAAFSPLIFPTVYARSQKGGVPLGSGMVFVVAASICAVALAVATCLPEDPPSRRENAAASDAEDGGVLDEDRNSLVTPGTGASKLSSPSSRPVSSWGASAAAAAAGGGGGGGGGEETKAWRAPLLGSDRAAAAGGGGGGGGGEETKAWRAPLLGSDRQLAVE